MKIHPVLHTSDLLPATEAEPLPGQIHKEPPPIEIDGEEEYTVERILDARVHRRRLQFLVKWRGWDNPDSNTWEPEEHVLDAEALDFFEQQNPELLSRLRARLRKT
jgi:hypothetical protein